MTAVIGIDPGARYVSVLVRDGEDVLYSSIFVREEDMPPVKWATAVTRRIIDEVIQHYPGAPIGIEGISDPKGFKGGKKALLNPKHIIRTGIVVGAVAALLEEYGAVIVPPGNNGSRANELYPACLSGRRPATLAGTNKGAGTRSHEKSAYDVAGETQKLVREGWTLDFLPQLL